MKSERGVGTGGETINPQELPEERVDTTAEPRAAPPPGLPVSDEEYERMKEEAKHAPTPRVKNAQQDRPKKKRKTRTRRR